MSTGKLTDTVFIAGPDDSLGVVDVYDQSGGGVVNSYQEQYHAVGDALDDFLSGANSLAQELKSGLDFINSNLNAITNAINSALGLGNSIAQQFQSLKNSASGANKNGKSNLDSIKNTLSSLGGIPSISGKKTTGILGSNGAAAKGLISSATRAENLFNPKTDTKNNISIARVSDRLSGGLNNEYRNKSTNNQSISLQETLSNSIVNYGSLSPLANNLSSAINNDLDVILGGDRAAVTSILNPSINRAGTLEKPTKHDNDNGTLTAERLIENLPHGELLTAIKDLTPQAQDILVRGLNMEKVYVDNKITVSGSAAIISPQVSEQNKNAISNIISSITNGEYEVKSKTSGMNCSVIAGVVHLASKSGFPKPFECIAKYETHDVMVEVAKPLLKRAVEEGDFEMIKDISFTAVSKEIKAIVPNIISEIKARLKRPDNLSQQEYARYYKVVKDIFINIDVNWATFKSGNIVAIDATGIAENPFFSDLLEAQLNELKSPELNLSNLQVSYPMDGIDNPTKLLNEIGLGESKIVLDESGNEITIPPKKFTKPEVLKINPEHYKDEPFLLLGKVFLNNSVDNEIKKHFPYFYETIQDKPISPIL